MTAPVWVVRAGRLLLWPVRTARRLLTLGWLVGFGVVGAAHMAFADPVNNIVTGPDLAGGGEMTVFERVPWDAYSLPFSISDSASGTGGIGTAWWTILNGIADAVLFLAGAVVRGAIDAVEWVLQLTGLYGTHALAIDSAVQSVANVVFWPLIAASIAAAGMTIYGKAKQNGHGSVLGDIVQLVVIGTITIAFVAAPSKIVSTVDDARTAVTDAGMVGYSHATSTPDSAAGFPAVAVPDSSTGAVRRLADGLWNVYFVMPWCFAAFGEDLSLCKSVGSDYLTQSARWAQIDASQTDRKGGNAATCDQNGANGTAALDAYLACKDKAQCADEVQSQCEWVRGQSYARFGAVILALLITLPLAGFLLALAFFGLLAVVGFLLLLLTCPLFVLPALIPGFPRRISVRYFEALASMFLQSVVITFVIGAVMVLSSIFALMVPTVGLLFVAILNLAALMMAFKLRAMFENLAGMSNPARGGMSGYVAMRMFAGAGRMARRVGAAGATTAGLAGRNIASAAGHGTGGYMNAGGKLPALKAANPATRLRRHFAPTPFMPDSARSGPVADAAQQTSGPRAITTGARATPWAPRPAGFPHSEPKVDRGPRTWGGTGRPGDTPSPASTRIDPSEQPFRPTRRDQTVPGAPPMRQTVNAAHRHDPLAITRRPMPVTPRAQLPGPRPVRPQQTSGPQQAVRTPKQLSPRPRPMAPSTTPGPSWPMETPATSTPPWKTHPKGKS